MIDLPLYSTVEKLIIISAKRNATANKRTIVGAGALSRKYNNHTPDIVIDIVTAISNAL